MNREIQFYATLKTRWSKNRETRELVSICIKFIKEQRFYTRTGLNPYLARDIIKFSQNFRLIGIFLSLSLPLLRSDLESKLFGYIAKIQTKHREFHSIFPLKSNNSIILCCVNSSIPTIWLEKYCSFEFRFASRREGIQGIGITLTNWTLIDVLGGGRNLFEWNSIRGKSISCTPCGVIYAELEKGTHYYDLLPTSFPPSLSSVLGAHVYTREMCRDVWNIIVERSLSNSLLDSICIAAIHITNIHDYYRRITATHWIGPLNWSGALLETIKPDIKYGNSRFDENRRLVTPFNYCNLISYDEI